MELLISNGQDLIRAWLGYDVLLGWAGVKKKKMQRCKIYKTCWAGNE